MPWLQLTANIPKAQTDNLEDQLLNAGAASVTLQEYIPPGSNENPILEPNLGETPLWEYTKVIGLFTACVNTTYISSTIQLPGLEPAHLRWEQLEDKDWEREWMSNYQPIQCTDSLWICPSWQEPPAPNATNILLDPGLAFGTGTHPTTFLCMQWLGRQDIHHKHVIDYGCGSGILGISALKLGAGFAYGVDIDPQALLASEKNALSNGLTIDQFKVYKSEDTPSSMGDIVIANILAGLLVELSTTLIERLAIGGQLCLSGILIEQAATVISAYEQHITFTPTKEKDGWACISGYRHT